MAVIRPREVAAVVTDWIGLFLEEDLGAGDATSEALPALEAPGHAAMVLREPGVVAGLRHAVEVFRRLGCVATPSTDDGRAVAAGTVLEATGRARDLLAAERLALNIVARMTGIATEVRSLQQRLAAAGSQARVAGTRKTTPGFRVFEKEAIALGGGDPHRMGLFDVMMVKDNHREAAGDVAAATRSLRAAHPQMELEVEVESLQDGLAAAEAGADWILIDNQSPETGRAWAQTLREAHPALRIEASGGIRPDTVTDYGWADRISLGALTQAARSLDVGLDWRTP